MDLSLGLLIASAMALGLLVIGAIRFPQSLSPPGFLTFVASLAALVAFAASALWVRVLGSGHTKRTLRLGGVVGFFLAAWAMVNHTLEIFASLPAGVSTLLGVSSWGVMFFCFGAISSAVFVRTESTVLGLRAALWASALSAAGTVLCGLALGMFFGAKPDAIQVRSLFENAAAHLWLAPLVAVIVSVVSLTACVAVRRTGRGTAMAVGLLMLVILGAGVVSIRHVSTVPRPERPPFVLVGLCSLGLSLSVAYAVGARIREASSSPPEVLTTP